MFAWTALRRQVSSTDPSRFSPQSVSVLSFLSDHTNKEVAPSGAPAPQQVAAPGAESTLEATPSGKARGMQI